MTMTLDDRSLAILAHELRHPLAPIRHAVALMRRLDLQEPHLVWACQVLDRQSQWLAQLVEGLGDLARLNTGAIPLHWEVLNVTEVLTEALELCQPLFSPHHHHVTVSLPEESARVEGDRIRLTQVLVNLLSNATKYTELGGRITAEIRISETEVSVSIRDTGRGIAAEVLPHIFEWGVQGDCSDPGTTGWGVGLTLVKRLVILHRGRIKARSGGAGQGSEFSVYLPRCSSAISD